MTTQQRVMLFLMPVFLALYALPLWMAAGAVGGGWLRGDTPIGAWFFFVLTQPNDPMAMMQRLLLPITAGITVVALWSKQGLWMTLSLVVLTVLSLVCVVVIWWYLIVPANAVNLWQPVPQGTDNTISEAKEFDPVARTYLIGRFEALAAYLAVLLGISAKKE